MIPKYRHTLITREQRLALKRIFDRCPLYVTPDGRITPQFTESDVRHPDHLTYRQFRGTVLIGSGCLMVQWCNMWLGIEPDGYTHS